MRQDIPDIEEILGDEYDETAEIVADAVARERAAVVAWLREVAPSAPTRRGADELTWCADHIERGEHRRGEEGT